LQVKTKIVCSLAADSKPVKQQVNEYSDTSPFTFPDCGNKSTWRCKEFDVDVFGDEIGPGKVRDRRCYRCTELEKNNKFLTITQTKI